MRNLDPILQRLSKLYTPLIQDTLDKFDLRKQSLCYDIRPIYPDAKAVGYAFTVLAVQIFWQPNIPYAKELEVLDNLKPNDISVVTTNGEYISGFWGELMSTAAVARGSNGAVVDGLTRDAKAIERMKFPVFAKGISPYDSYGRIDVIDYNVPINCGGVLVNPGDVIFADYEGIVVIPKDLINEVVPKAEEKFYGENKVREELRKGKLASEVFEKYKIL